MEMTFCNSLIHKRIILQQVLRFVQIVLPLIFILDNHFKQHFVARCLQQKSPQKLFAVANWRALS